MKIGRYIILPASEDKEIKNLKYVKDKNNNVELNWDWPSSGELKLALVLSDVSGGELENILQTTDESKIKIVTRQFDKNYKEQLNTSKKRFTVYPATFGEKNEIIVYNQKQNNNTPDIERHINITYEILETSKLFSNTRTVEIKVHKMDSCEINLEDALYYTVSSSGRKYPADMDTLRNYALIRLQKDENIFLKVHDDFKDIVHISEI